MKKIENINKTLVLGESGTLVKCMLLDSVQDIKRKNEHLTDEEVKKTHEILQSEIIQTEKGLNDENSREQDITA